MAMVDWDWHIDLSFAVLALSRTMESLECTKQEAFGLGLFSLQKHNHRLWSDGMATPPWNFFPQVLVSSHK